MSFIPLLYKLPKFKRPAFVSVVLVVFAKSEPLLIFKLEIVLKLLIYDIEPSASIELVSCKLPMDPRAFKELISCGVDISSAADDR